MRSSQQCSQLCSGTCAQHWSSSLWHVLAPPIELCNPRTARANAQCLAGARRGCGSRRCCTEGHSPPAHRAAWTPPPHLPNALAWGSHSLRIPLLTPPWLEPFPLRSVAFSPFSAGHLTPLYCASLSTCPPSWTAGGGAAPGIEASGSPQDWQYTGSLWTRSPRLPGQVQCSCLWCGARPFPPPRSLLLLRCGAQWWWVLGMSQSSPGETP